MIGKLGKEALTNIAVPQAKDFLSQLATKATLRYIILKEKISQRGAVRAGIEFTSLISNQDMGDIFRIIKSLANSGLLICGVTETVKDEIKKKVEFLLP